MSKIKSHNTAIKRNTHSAPVKWALQQALVRGSVFDYGCGRGDDVRLLNEAGIEAVGYDPYHAPKNDPDRVDFSQFGTLFCNYVLNVIDDPKERSGLVRNLRNIWLSMPSFSKMIISVRSKQEIETEAKKKGWKKHKGGYITTSDTFQKGFTAQGLKGIFTKENLKVEHVEKVSGGYIVLIQK